MEYQSHLSAKQHAIGKAMAVYLHCRLLSTVTSSRLQTRERLKPSLGRDSRRDAFNLFCFYAGCISKYHITQYKGE